MQKKPNLFIIGAPKSGTTSLSYYLSQHPQIYFSKIKEPHFFNTDSNHGYGFNFEEYMKLFNEAQSSNKFLAEGSVWYMYSGDAVDNILKFNPNAKFIVLLRNPVDLFFSLHQELLFQGTENIKSPKSAWFSQKERFLGKKIPKSCSDKNFLQYKDVCSLGEQFQRVSQKVKPENLYVITLDEISLNTDSTYRELLKFLGVDVISLSNYEVINEKKVRKSILVFNFIRKTNKIIRKVGIKKKFGVATLINSMNVKHGKNLEFNEEKNELKPTLRDVFYKDILLLEKLTGKNLNHWK